MAFKLKRAFHYTEPRTIGSPGGNFSANVRFLSDDGENVFWWSPRPHREKKLEKNLFGHGTRGPRNSLNMDVQFNVPVVKFFRGSGGAFLRHVPTNRIVLAHRGIVTIGHGRVRKELLFDEMGATRREASTREGTSEFLLIGELESPSLVNGLNNFAAQVRSAVQGATFKRSKHKQLDRRVGPWSGRFARLRGYFDEFSGQLQIKGRAKTVADCYHGDVVGALRDALDDSFKAYKSREVELIIGLKSRKAFLFEVKTSASTQTI